MGQNPGKSEQLRAEDVRQMLASLMHRTMICSIREKGELQAHSRVRDHYDTAPTRRWR